MLEVDRLPVERNCSLVEAVDAGKRAEEGALPRAVPPKDPEDPVPDGEGGAVKRHRVPEALPRILNDEPHSYARKMYFPALPMDLPRSLEPPKA